MGTRQLIVRVVSVRSGSGRHGNAMYIVTCKHHLTVILFFS